MVAADNTQVDQIEPVACMTQPKKKGTLNTFWLLSNAKNSGSRVDASSRLLKYVSANPTEAAYMLKRLLRGLASPLEHTRHSFFVCLTEFIRQQDLECAAVREEAQQTLKVTGSKGEESLYLLGQILADVAVLRAGVVRLKSDQVEVLSNLIDKGSRRSYLKLLALNTIIEYYLCDGSVVSNDEVVTSVGESFRVRLPEAGLDDLLFILTFLNRRLQDNESPDFLMDHFGFKDIKKTSNLERICKILFSTTRPLSVLVYHPVLTAFASLVTCNGTAVKVLGLLLPDMKTSLYKGQLGIALLREILKTDPSCVEKIISVDVLEMLSELCGKNVVNPVVEVVELIEREVKSGSVSCWTMLTRVLNCNVSWDKYVPGNLVASLLSTCDADTLVQTGNLLQGKFLSDAKMSERVYTAGLLARLIGDPRVVSRIDWRVEQLRVLLRKTLITSPDDTTPLSREAKHQLKDVFYRGLDSNCKSLVDNVNLVHSVMQTAIQLLAKDQVEVLKPIVDRTAKDAWTKVVSTVTKLGRDWSANNQKETGVFLLLFSHIGLQFFCQPDMAVDVLSDLQPVYSNWTKAKSAKGDPAGIEVVVEILLSLLAQNKHLLRKVVNCIFKVICYQLNEPALMSLLDVIRSQGSADQQSNDGDESESNDDDEDGEDGLHEEKNEKDDSDDEDEDEDEDEPSSEESEIESDDEIEDDSPKADVIEKVRKALGEHAQDSETENDDVDMDDIPDEDMKKLDETLVNAFKALGGHKSGAEKKKDKLDHMANQHFKLRVLDLIDIYVHHKPCSKHVFFIISYLIDNFKILINSPKEEVLYTKIKAILKNCCCFKLEPTDEADSVRILEYLFQLGTSPSPAIINLGNVHARLCLTALKVNLPKNTDQVKTLYLEALEQFFNNNNCVLSYEVFELAVQHPWNGALEIAKETSKRSFDPSVRHFRKSQGLTILYALLKNQQLDEGQAKKKTKIMSSVLDQIVTNMETDLEKAKPKQLLAIFQILKGVKQQKLMTEEQNATINQQLQKFGQCSMGTSKQVPQVKKSLKKLLSFYGINVKIGARSDKVAVDQASKIVDQTLEPETVEVKKKKKSKSKETEQRKKEKKARLAESAELSSVPSFAPFVVDPTQVFHEMGKKKKIKNKKRKLETKEAGDNKKTKAKS